MNIHLTKILTFKKGARVSSLLLQLCNFKVLIQQISAERSKDAPHFNKFIDLTTSKLVSNLFSHNVSPKVYTAI